MKKLAIVGSGDLGKQIAYHSISDNHYTPVGFFDDNVSQSSTVLGLPILGSLDDITTSFKQNIFDVLMIGLGYKQFGLREKIYNKYKGAIPFGTILHSSSFIDPSSKIGEGVIIYPRCVIDMNSEIMNNVLLNVGCIVAHDSKVREHSFLSPGVQIAGFVDIGRNVNLGIGTIVIDNITISDYIKTGAGAVVIDDLTCPGLYLGIPAKIKRNNEKCIV